SVYSREAGIERKIHIEEAIFERNEEVFPITVKESVYSAGIKKQGDIIKGSHKIKNNSTKEVTFVLFNSNSTLKIQTTNTKLKPGEELVISFELNSLLLKGFNRISYSIGVEGFKNQLELFLTTEVK
ncbi:MAG: hypothetical protein ACKN86_01145, partial [Crocinitomicaceae bacterium]